MPKMISRSLRNGFRLMWPILGHITLDTLRVIDWALAALDVAPQIYMGGISMGGDIAVAAAGIDHRIKRVAAIVATPDWKRPGMQDLFRPGMLLAPGVADAYPRYFYEQLDFEVSGENHCPKPVRLLKLDYVLALAMWMI
jgi:uncharacterized protein